MGTEIEKRKTNKLMNQKVRKSIFVQNMEKNLGLIGPSCKAAQICRTTYYNWLIKDEKFREQINEILEYQIDIVEGQLHKNILEGKETSAIFYLKTKAAARGFVEKQEIQHSGEIEFKFGRANDLDDDRKMIENE